MHILLTSILSLGSLGIVTNGETPNFELIHNYSVTGNRYSRQTNGKKCQIPYDPHGEYKIFNDNSGQFVAGDYVIESTPAVLNCHSSYIRIPLGLKYSVCENGLWIPEYKCERTCSTLVSTDSTKIRCYFNNVALESCESPRSGTTAEFDCQPYHENLYSGNSFVHCQHGDWVGKMHECDPICGEKRSVARTNIINGTNVKKGNYPWQVGIYKSNQEFICGGSIISLRIILTAAHCLTNNDGVLYPKENYLVTVGKYYRSYSDVRDHGAHYPTIQSFHVPIEYKGDQLQHQADIAVIVLSVNLVLSDVIQPICVDWFKRYEAEQLILNNHGLVTGWGYTMEGQNLSIELKELSVPYIPYDQCFRQVPKNFTKYVRSDKICGGYLDLGSSVCGGDSGGALAFPLLSTGRYYIRGIVSVSPATLNNECNSRQYGLYTSLSKYLDFLKDQYITHGPLPANTSKSVPSILPIHEEFSNKTSSTSSPTTMPPLTDENNNCIMKSSGVRGQCQLLSACPAALEALQIKQSFPQLCGLSGTEAKVCCAVNPSIDSLVSLVVGDKSKRKCREYGQYVFDHSAAIGVPRQPGTNADSCNMIAVDMIVGLNNAKLKEFPHMALIFYENEEANENNNWRCCGSLISDKFVLTAGHCLKPFKKEPKYVRLGELILNFDRDDAKIQDINILAQYLHPNYSQPYNNIGLLELEKRATLSTYVRPACLDTNSSTDYKYSVVSGWGFTSDLSDFSSELLKLKLETFSNSECNKIYNNSLQLNKGIVDETQICAGSRNEFIKGICEGYAGSPLQVSNSDDVYCTYKIIGVTSLGRACGQANVIPSVYTKVSAYIKWIEDIVSP